MADPLPNPNTIRKTNFKTRSGDKEVIILIEL